MYAFMKRVSPYYYFNGDFYPRPTMCYGALQTSRLTGITMQNAPFWTLHPAGCDDVLIQGIRVLNPLDCTQFGRHRPGSFHQCSHSSAATLPALMTASA